MAGGPGTQTLGNTSATLFDKAVQLESSGERELARQAYIDVLAHDLNHAGALARLGRLLLDAGYTSAARTTFAHAVAAHPWDAAAHVNLGHLLRLADEPDRARAAYEAALACDPDCPEAHQGLSYVLEGIDELAASRHRDAGFAGRALTAAPYRGRGEPIRVLRLVSARGGNIPARHILDDRQFETHTLVVEYAGRDQKLPPHGVVFNTIGDADRCAAALHMASRVTRRSAVRVVNSPERVLQTARVAGLERLACLPGVVAPRVVALPRSAFAQPMPAGFAMPFLLRSPGFHTGQHFVRVDDPPSLAAALEVLPGDPVLALENLNAAGEDGAYRKYRVMLIGGRILPLHLAISANWKVHYFTAAMASCAAYRAEEARFLDDMEAVLGPVALQALACIDVALGLDYAGVDFALAPDGRLLLFEANATMTIVPPPLGAMWDYRRPAVECALLASRALLR